MAKKICGFSDAARAIDTLKNDVGFVGIVERFHESLVLLRQWMNCEKLDIRFRPKNVMSDNSIKQAVLRDADCREAMIDANREDVRLYSYVREHIYPNQKKSYGPTLAEDVERFAESNRPGPRYPRQLTSLFLRELIYKPLALRLARAEPADRAACCTSKRSVA